MAFNELEVHEVERARLLRVRDAVKELFKVNVIESNISNVTALNKTCTNNVICQSQSSTTQHDEEILLTVTLLFEESGASVEEIEKAKNFARTHLLPGPDYIRSAHQLENQKEFNMVLESSQDIQTTTTALLTFDPQYLEVALEGPASTLALARSKVVGILDKYREQSRIDSDISSDINFTAGGLKFYEDMQLDNFVDKRYNNGSSELSHLLINGSMSVESIQSNECKSKKYSVSFDDVIQNCEDSHKIQPNKYLNQSEIDTDDIESDASLSPLLTVPVKSDLLLAESKHEDPWEKLSSSDDESLCEENILTDPRYSKKIEQCLKLGYSEKQVMKALAKHGPDCAINDLLSELIKIGASDADLSVNRSMSLEPDTLLVDISDDVLGGSQRLINAVSLESVESSGFSSSADPQSLPDANNLRDIIIDGSNVAMSHGKRFFSCRGIQIAVNWFKDRGHKHITAFVPQWRKETSRPDAPITDQDILLDLEKEGIVVFTPARRVKGRRVVCYDDRYILKLAVDTDGIVVSNDVYRDLVNEREDFRKVVDQRLLMYSFVNDRFMPPEDPLGRLGPPLDNFLRKVSVEPTPKPQDCPYGKKCTYGNKCRFYHPERGFAPQKLITETLKEQADLKLQERATRLSEIAEKGKRSKQKLSRTKSLVPWEPLLPSSQGAASGTKNQQEKPKLAHSKSLVLPTKSSDYLNESRRKLEEAELTEAVEKMSTMGVSQFQQFPVQANLSDDSEIKNSSQRSSPSPQKDAIRQVLSTGDILSKISLPVKSSSTISPLPSPSHLTVPKLESPERYLSGHLYLAKKLSDESVESNFFSEHTSSPSSTRTSSPVVALSKIPEQTHPMKRQSDVGGSFTSPPPFHPSLFYQQQPSYGPQIAPLDLDNIPNLSIFEHGMSHFPQRGDNTDTSPAYKMENVDSALGSYICQKINPLLPDSGPYALVDPFLNQYQSPHQLPYSYSFVRPEQPQPSEHLNLRRAFSSTGNIKSSEDLHVKLGRRSSGFSPTYGAVDQHMMKPQIMSTLEKSSLYQCGHLRDFNRQNSSSDSQMHAGELQNVVSPFFPFGNAARNFQEPHLPNVQHYQAQHHQLQQQHHEALESQLLKPGMNVWADPASQMNMGRRSSTQTHFNPVDNRLTAHNTTHMPQFSPTTATPNRMVASTYNLATPYTSHPHYNHQPQMMYTTQLDPSSQNMFPAARRQSFPSHPHHSISVHPALGYSDNQQITSKDHRASSMSLFLPEDAPIVPEDPRYMIYYPLTQLFPEQYVRRVMNQHSNERNPDNICKLLLKYKEQAEK